MKARIGNKMNFLFFAKPRITHKSGLSSIITSLCGAHVPRCAGPDAATTAATIERGCDARRKYV